VPVNEPARHSWRPSLFIRASAVLHLAAGAALALDPSRWPAVGLTIVANHLAIGVATMTPRGGLLGPNLVRLPASASRGRVVLTFDDGPDPEVTPRLLELLAARGARATFFCVGHKVERNPELAREVQRQGHRIENHSYHHSNAFALLGPGRVRREIAAAQAAIERTVGRRPVFFRAPAGMRNPWLDFVLARLELRLVSWTRRGFDTLSREPQAVARRLVRHLAPGDILLLHDGAAARDRTGQPVVLESLSMVLDALEGQGLRSVPLDDALGKSAA
jgi:peptidoglycan/xylan/chitin deacetylase (PgdA/CDA1 family)